MLHPQSLLSGILRILVGFLSLQALHHVFVAAAPLRDEGSGTLDIPQTLDSRHFSSLYPRARVFSTEEMTTMIDQGGLMVNKKSIFWTGWPWNNPRLPYFLARDWANEKFPDCSTIMYDRAFTASDYSRMNTADLNDPPTTEDYQLTLQHMSKAFTRRSSGVVYVVIPDGQNPNPTSVWSVWEYPTLTRNQRIDKIVRVGFPSKQEVPIWWRGNPPQGETAPPGKL